MEISPEQGEELASRIMTYRNEHSIIVDWSELKKEPVSLPDEVLNKLQSRTFQGR